MSYCRGRNFFINTWCLSQTFLGTCMKFVSYNRNTLVILCRAERKNKSKSTLRGILKTIRREKSFIPLLLLGYVKITA